MAEGGGGGDGSGMGSGGNTDISSILAGLSEMKFILGGIAALSGLIFLKTIKINQNIRTLLMCAVFVLFGVLVIIHQPSPLRAVVDPVTALATGSAITLKQAACRSSERNCSADGSASLGHCKRS
jgi:xanthine/uracil permease